MARRKEGTTMSQYNGEPVRLIGDHWYFVDEDLAKEWRGRCRESQRIETRKRRDAWLEAHGLVESEAYRCLATVIGKRCRELSRSSLEVCDKYHEKNYTWFDHSALFYSPSDKEHVLTGQPYDVSITDYEEMERWAKAHGLKVSISVEDAWWYPGRTPLIVWRKERGGKR